MDIDNEVCGDQCIKETSKVVPEVRPDFFYDGNVM